MEYRPFCLKHFPRKIDVPNSNNAVCDKFEPICGNDSNSRLKQIVLIVLVDWFHVKKVLIMRAKLFFFGPMNESYQILAE